MVSYVTVKFQVIVFMYRVKIDNSEFSLLSNSMCYRKIPAYHFCPVHHAITRDSPKCSELLLWQDTQSFNIWGFLHETQFYS